MLVVIHSAELDVLLLERADAPGYWQSVTGSKDSVGETLVETCIREVGEETGILLITRADVPEKRELISTLRQGIETTFSQLWDQFIDRIYSRSWLGLWNTIQLKLIHYNLCQAGVLSN